MSLRDTIFYIVGVGFLALAKTKNLLQGYSSPKPIDISETARCIEYDINVVEYWIARLREYTCGDFALEGKNVLELGPGSDVGIGIYLLAKGCAQYNACDVNDLMKSTPDAFYEQLFDRIESMDTGADIGALKGELRDAKAGNPSRMNCVVRDDFDIASAFGEATMDMVFSQAAFEHFDDIDATISQLSSVCRPGATLIAVIDLKTHSRWIRDNDPNNIYRYSDRVYNAFRFRGIPNRVRPYQYKKALERFGWTDVAIVPLTEIEQRDGVNPGVSKAFADGINQMEYLSVVVCARKG